MGNEPTTQLGRCYNYAGRRLEDCVARVKVELSRKGAPTCLASPVAAWGRGEAERGGLGCSRDTRGWISVPARHSDRRRPRRASWSFVTHSLRCVTPVQPSAHMLHTGIPPIIRGLQETECA